MGLILQKLVKFTYLTVINGGGGGGGGTWGHESDLCISYLLFWFVKLVLLGKLETRLAVLLHFRWTPANKHTLIVNNGINEATYTFSHIQFRCVCNTDAFDYNIKNELS